MRLFISVCIVSFLFVSSLKTETYEEDRKAYIKKIESLKKAALSGDLESQHMLGITYEMHNDYLLVYYQINVANGEKEAQVWYEMAAKKGYKRSQYQLGKMLFYGNGVAQNKSKGLEWLILSAEQSNDAVEFAQLASTCKYEKNYLCAFKWYEKALMQDLENTVQNKNAGNSSAMKLHITRIRDDIHSIEQICKDGIDILLDKCEPYN